MAWNDDLYGNSLKIAASSFDKLRVMAGPGTGKSFAMKRRIVRLIEEDLVAPEAILAVTFTRTSAHDLKRELQNIGVKGAGKIKAMTLHSFCFGLLNQLEVFNELARKPRPMKTFTSHGLPQFELSPLLADLNLVTTIGNKREKFALLKAFEAGWARRQDENLWVTNNDERQFKELLVSWLTNHDAMLIGEVIPLALQYLESNPASDIFDKYVHVVVDEYQDLNKAEQMLLDLISKKGSISIVGDIDQSIYSFRYAHPDGILDFSVRHNSVDEHTLQECRRCGKQIVSVAAALISNNHMASQTIRLNPSLNNPEGSVISVQWKSSDEEASGLVKFISHLISSQGFGAKDILILSPRRLLGYKLRDLLSEKNISVHSFFHEEAVEDIKAQEAVVLLNLLADPEDKVALRFWLGIGGTKWRASQYATLSQYAMTTPLSIRNILEECCNGSRQISGIASLVKSFQSLLIAVASFSGKSTAESIDLLFPVGKDCTQILREAALLFISENPTSTIKDLWGHIETILTQPEMPEEGDFVRIMSLHKSKGLTSKVTIITSCIQGLIPKLMRDESPEQVAETLKEQRRLFYVALTRAKDLLILSSFTSAPSKVAYQIGITGQQQGKNIRVMASQFFSELGPDAPCPISGNTWAASKFLF